MSRRYRKDCPIPGCSKTNFLKLSNHLADVHFLKCNQRKIWLQQARRDKYSISLDKSLVAHHPLCEMDVSFKHPTNIQVCGPTSCGKSYWTEKLLRNVNQMFNEEVEKIIYCYSIYQPQFLIMEREVPNIQFIQGFPEDIYSLFDKIPGVLVLDDLMNESTNKDSIADLFTKGSHHFGVSSIFLTQNLFAPGKHSRTLSLNSHYIVAFKHPRDSLGVSILARQAFPKSVKYVMESYDDAVQQPYGYLVFDFHPTTPEKGRLRTLIFPGEQQVAYVRRI